MHEIVPVAFWILFPIGALAIAGCLISVFWKNLQLTDVRWHLDDGAEAGPGREIYELYLVSNRLASWAGVLAVALALSGFAGALGGTVVKIVAFAASVALALAADHLRGRHERLDLRFQRTAGESLGDVYRRINEDAVRA